ncbi:LacI family DNA-binding transcriptional regulator [Roseomonas genomospecies 6]|uniref:LacI family DNA-binding transcriptional regulator n=1 Tax=Roseomonas genomospecies 6 TaxID=214106 RepID=A0A9W7NLI0_9PROT|nr:LacI family DNA-binding transcriptional regulator [Roseomonas genomospecies 6]KAA0682236.1 LacI family DNA-binding transcriptional regulator [Roseomonas genomospecies 6]
MTILDERGGPARITLTEVANHAGVSRSTVSLVLRGSPLVATETRERVQAAIEALGYVYNRGAATLRATRTDTVGLLVCEISNSFYGELTAGVDDVLGEEGVVAFLANTAESPERQDRFLQRMREHNVDGVIVCPTAGTPPDLLERLRRWQLPCVQALRFVSARDGDYAGVDYEFGMEMVTEHLIRLGHRRIAFVGGNLSHSAATGRRAGFGTAMRRHGLSPDLIVRCPVTRRAGLDAVGPLLDLPDPPTAMLCYNDMVAFGAMLGLEARGLKAGRDIAVTGFDDVTEAAMSRPALTTVATSARQIGQEAARLLLRRIADPQGAPERVILPARLVIRESCGAMRSSPARHQ